MRMAWGLPCGWKGALHADGLFGTKPRVRASALRFRVPVVWRMRAEAAGRGYLPLAAELRRRVKGLAQLRSLRRGRVVRAAPVQGLGVEADVLDGEVARVDVLASVARLPSTAAQVALVLRRWLQIVA